jgi:acetyl-CoA C-acetyltransferase
VVELQEPYTCFELSYYESLGLCAPGEAADLIRSGATQIDGDIPVNPSGGCAGANPIGAAGLIRVVEAAAQIMGKAGSLQIPGVRLALAQSGGGWANLRGVAVLSA